MVTNQNKVEQQVKDFQANWKIRLVTGFQILFIFAFVRLYALYTGVTFIPIPGVDHILGPVAAYLRKLDTATFFENALGHIMDFYYSL